MKKIKGRKQMISFLLSICMIITMIPLNAFASSVASASDFKYDTPEDITIYKNETEVVILMDYGYTYENGNDYKKCNLETISASSNNRNIEIRQPEQSEKESGWKMKVKGLSEGISTVTLQYSWKYNGVKKTGTSSFKVTVRAYQYCWKLDGDYDYLEDEYDSDTSNLYINESKTWDITLKKIYYKENRKALGDFKKAKETAADEEVRQKGASFYAKTCITLTDYQEAIKTLEAKGEYELADWMNLAFAYKCTGNWKKSKELLLQAVLYYPEDYRLYMRLCYLECELQDRKPQALKDYSQLKVYYDKAVSLLNGKTGNEEWIQLKSLIVQLKEYGWM